MHGLHRHGWIGKCMDCIVTDGLEKELLTREYYSVIEIIDSREQRTAGAAAEVDINCNDSVSESIFKFSLHRICRCARRCV